LNVGFLFWGLQLIAAFVLAPIPLAQIVFLLAVFVFLNAVPEVVYVGRHVATEVLVESYRFIVSVVIVATRWRPGIDVAGPQGSRAIPTRRRRV